MQEISPRDSAGFKMLAASSEPSAEPAPIREWISSMKTMSSLLSLSSLRMPLRRSSNWPRYLVPATIKERSSATIRLLARKIGTLPSMMRCGQALDDGGLAHAGLAQQDRVVLGAAREDLDDAVDLVLAADQRIERPLRGERRQVAAVLGEERQLLLLLRGLALLGDREHLLAHRVDVEAVLRQDAHRGTALDAQDADQQVLGADGGVEHALGFVGGVGEDLLGLFGEGELGGGRDPLDEHALAFDLAADVLGLHLEAPEDLRDGLLPLAEDAQQDVLRFDHPAAELAGFVAGEEEGSTGFFVVLLKHTVCLSIPGAALRQIPR